MKCNRLDMLDRWSQRRRRRGLTATSIAPFVEAEAKLQRKSDRVVSAVLAFWQEIDLPYLNAITGIVYSGSRLTITVSSASVSYELDRELRGGLRDLTIKRSPATISRFILKIGM